MTVGKPGLLWQVAGLLERWGWPKVVPLLEALLPPGYFPHRLPATATKT